MATKRIWDEFCRIRDPSHQEKFRSETSPSLLRKLSKSNPFGPANSLKILFWEFKNKLPF